MPEGQKNLWKNIDWTNEDEKRAFFNKYFKKTKFVYEIISDTKREFKADLGRFIENNKVQDGKVTRPIKVSDIKKQYT